MKRKVESRRTELKMARSLSATSGTLKAVQPKSVNLHIFRALVSLASAALLIRVMGLLNQVVVSSRFGAGPRMDAYFIASSLPLLLAQLLGSTIEVSVVPAYARIRMQGTKEQAYKLFSTVLNLLIVCTVLITLLMFLFRPQVMFLSAPGSRSNILEFAGDLAPFIFPVFVLQSTIGYLECILNTEGQFGWPAYAGMLVPLTTAVFVFTMGRSIGVVMLCVGMVVGLCLQVCVFIIRAHRAGLVYRFVLDVRHPEVASIVKAGWPVLIGALIGQATNLIDLIFSSFLPPGSISALNYALKLTGVFTGVIFVSVGRAILPYLSRQASMNDMKGFKETLRLYIWIVGIGTTVMSVFAIVLAHPVVHLLFQRGEFTANDTSHTAITFIGFAVGLTPIALVFILLRAFSALGKTKVFLPVTICSLAANALFDYIFFRIWQSEGIALSTSAAYVCSMLILFFTLRRTIGELHIFTPPSEIVDLLRKVGTRLGLFQRGVQKGRTLAVGSAAIVAGKKTTFPLLHIPYSMQRYIIRFGIIIAVFAAGVAGVFLNSLYALRISLASIIMFALMRYNFVLLISWVLINGPNAMPIFRGTNVLIGLTAPTLLLMTSMPIKQTIKLLPALGFFCAYLLWAATTIGISPFGLGPSLTAWVLRLDCVAVSILAINVLTTQRRLQICIDVLLLVSVGIALYGIYGYITKQNGIVDPTTSLYRIVSIFTAPPGLALFFSVVIPLALYRIFISHGFKRIIGSIVVLIFIVTAGLTFTRSAYLYIPVSILIMAFFAPTRKIKNALLSGTSALSVIVVLVATIGNLPIFSRFFSQDVTTLNGRTYLWQAILSNFDPTKLLGNGIRASDALLISLHIGINGQGEIGTSPHDLFLGTLYDHGVIGLILLTMMFIVLLINLIAGMRKASGERRILFAVALAALISVLLQSFDSNDFWEQAISIYIWIIMVLPFALCWSKPEKQAEPDENYSDEPTDPRIKVVQRNKAVQQMEREQVTLV